MGVPKFFRYISERYPCLSEAVREYQLPEFDALYLDMNGIIHVCSHPNDADPHFRITEEQIFRDIFHYIESLFRMIQPQKLFFMAVDGVAPRAKMNQQRGRRFRSAKDAEVAEQEATSRGEKLPSVERFDSNCITPGTEFMTRLHEQLKYFVTFKISTDKLWQTVKVILSGHETPGEGEHKIMDYIRYMKSQPGYDPNTRHCLYGLDADLIMLGLCTHEPHFSLLREEVKYGKKNNQKRIPTPEETTFFLLHLSLMREYLDLEFQQLKTTITSFSYDLENIIDDWVLMGFLVGNDFIPHLPDLHINKGALPILYRAYIDVLPSLGGYINEGGALRLDRFQKYLEKLAAFDFEQFKEISADLRYLEAKTGRKPGGRERHSYKISEDAFQPPKNKDLAALIASTEEMLEGSDDDDENYMDIDTDEEDEDGTSFAEFCAHKNNYYVEKMDYEKVTPDVLRSQGEGYVRAIQWNLNYYYNGCCSWSWFYPHHYAPYISDIKNFSNLKLEYDVGKPFLPFQQLLAVLPAASKKLLPGAYQELMVNDESPIIHFYPTEFKTDLNGKRQDWEAVVLIPFIEQESLLQAMKTKEDLLTDEERLRNRHGPMHVYTYTPENLGDYLSPAYFPALTNHHAKVENVYREQIHVENSKLVKGLCPGLKLDTYIPGFPTLRHIPFTAKLQKAKIKVFESPSMGDNMILTILPQGHPNVEEVAPLLLGKSIFVNWPHLFEARVIGVSSEKKRFKLNRDDGSIISEEMSSGLREQWNLSRHSIEERYMTRMGIAIGKTEILVYACTMEDKKYVLVEDKLHYEKQWSLNPVAYAFQTTRTNIAIREDPIPQNLTIEHLYPPGTVVFTLELSNYGYMGTVVESTRQRVKINIESETEPNLSEEKSKLKKMAPQYISGNQMAQKLGITPLLLSRITGTIFVQTTDLAKSDLKNRKLNIGLNLKFNKRNEEVCGYSRKDTISGYWLYSSKTEDEIRSYIEDYPDVIGYLMENNAQDVNAKDLFPENTVEKIEELHKWLKDRVSAHAERQTCGAQILEEEVVSALEKYIDQFLKDKMKPKTLKLNVKPSSLYLPKPKLGQAPDQRVCHRLFDRVINVRESHTVPLGAKGTIIGMHDEDKGPKAMYDVLFDKTFTGGLSIRCSPHRGYRLPGQAFINITYGQKSDANITHIGKPTAVVEPSSGPKEEERIQIRGGGSNSAFASWRNKSFSWVKQEDGSPTSQGRGRRVSSDNQSSPRDTEAAGKNKQTQLFNSGHQSAPQQLSNEYLAMFNQLQKASPKTKGQLNNASDNSLMVTSNTLKKMLRIADDTTRKQPSTSDNFAGTKNQNPSNYTLQLLSLHQKKGRTPKYHYMDTKDGRIICTVICFNGKEYQGAPEFTNDGATESAARIAIQCLAIDDQKAAPFLSGKRPPLFMTLPQRPPFPSSKRLPVGSSNNWREPAQPSTLPPPPTNWYQTPRVPNFMPEWTFGNAVRPPHQNFFAPPSQFQHSSLNQFLPPPPQNQFGHQNQFGQMPPVRHQQNPFIPLQAESRSRYQPQHQLNKQKYMPRQMAPSEVKNPLQTTNSETVGPSTSGRISTRPPRSRIAANFNTPLNLDSDSNQGR